jgi:hypothetical protein
VLSSVNRNADLAATLQSRRLPDNTAPEHTPKP